MDSLTWRTGRPSCRGRGGCRERGRTRRPLATGEVPLYFVTDDAEGSDTPFVRLALCPPEGDIA